MLGLANLFVADPELRTGLVLYGLAPCIAMVIIFTFLAKGNTPMALVFVALNSIAQMLLIPVYAGLLIGSVSFDVLDRRPRAWCSTLACRWCSGVADPTARRQAAR